MRRFYNHSAREGYVYVAVLLTTLLIASLVASTLAFTTSRWKIAAQTRDRRAAVSLAHSELQRQLALAASDSDWRANQTNDVFTVGRQSAAWMAGGRGAVRHRVTDSDGSLTDDPTDSVVITVHSRVGDAAAAIQATLDPILDPLSLLGFGITCSDNCTLTGETCLSSQRPIQAGGSIVGPSDSRFVAPEILYGDNLNSNFVVRGDTGPSDVEMPSVDLIAAHSASAITINETQLPLVNGHRRLEERVLTASVSPFGSAGSVYRISTPNKQLVIEDCRIDATLIVEDATKVVIREANVWNAPSSTGLLLITNAPVDVVDWQGELIESGVNQNYNPSGAPWFGSTDSQTDDTYTSMLSGLIVTDGLFRIVNQINTVPVRLRGAIICQSFLADTHTTIEAMDNYAMNPPTGFWKVRHFVVQPGTIRQILTPGG